MRGIASARVVYLPECRCSSCGRVQYSSASVTIETGRVSAESLVSEIETAAAQRTVQPPVGWAIHGRGRYECRECLAARGQAPD